MNAKNYLIETIFSLNPVEDIYKAIAFSKILFNNEKEDYSTQMQIIFQLEGNVYKKIPLSIAFELYYTYKDYNLNHVINHKTKSGKIIKIPIYELRDAMRKLYFGIIEILYSSKIMAGDFDIGDSGDMAYKEEENQ